MAASDNIPRHLTIVGALCATALLMQICAPSARADAAGNHKRALLANVKRVAVVPPFFASDGDGKPADAKTDAPPENSEPASPSTAAGYPNQLRKLEEHAQKRVPERVRARTRFQLVPDSELTAAFKDLGLTPRGLFHLNGKIKGGKYAAPDAEAVRKLAARVHADAIVLDEMEAPKRTPGQYIVDASGLDYESAHVRSKSALYVMLPDGTEVLHDFVEALHPLTRAGTRDYLLVDWTEALDQAIEDFMDEFTRYTPGTP